MEVTSEKTAVRNYKDTVFRMLYKDKEKLLELYNAMNGTEYDNPEDLQIVTLENAIYMNMKNDLAFLIGTQLHLYEQQATVSPNMPYRFLQYVSREYEKLTQGAKIYGSRQLQLPAPQFVVFYNGKGHYPEAKTLRLSDAYRKEVQKPQMELIVRVLNINSGNNESLLEHCRTLREYMQYVELVRGYAEEMNIREAIERAVEECIGNGILKTFLMENKAEVVAMSIFEYDEEETLKVIREQEWEDGHDAGLKEGHQEGVLGVIHNMLKQNIPDEDILAFTGCTTEQLETEKAAVMVEL